MEESLLGQPVNQFNYSSSQQSRKSKKLLYLIIFIIFLIVVFILFRNVFKGSKKENKVPITPTPTEYQFPTDTPAPSAKPTQGVKASPTPITKAVNPVDVGTGLDRSTLTVSVQNGSGEVGAASKGSDILKNFGYKVLTTGNADNFDYQNTTIKVKSTKSNFLSLLKKDLGFSYAVGTASADLAADSSTDAVVIIGK